MQLVQNQVGDLPLEVGEGQGFEPGGKVVHRLGADTGDHRTVYFDAERLFVEPAAMTYRAGMGELVLPEEDADVLLVALLLQTLEEGKDPDVAAVLSIE